MTDSPINDEAANAAARVFYGRAYGSVGDEANKVLLDGAREALEAAYPAIRQQVAEQIAQAISTHYIPVTNVGGADPIPSDPTEWDEALHEAVTIAREIGAKG